MNKQQAELIKKIPDKELVKQLYLTQGLLLSIGLVLGWILFDSVFQLQHYLHFEWNEVMYYGVGSAAIVILIDGILMKFFPKEWYDDGGINEKIFQKRPIWHIFLLSLVIAITEEIVFRGVIQTQFGFIIASITFALLHLRYLTKPVLLISVLLLSFYIGWIFEVTGNLLVTIVAHFLIDFVFGCVIRIQYIRSNRKQEEVVAGGMGDEQ